MAAVFGLERAAGFGKAQMCLGPARFKALAHRPASQRHDLLRVALATDSADTRCYDTR